jgi:flagellar hook assembly protein FlgD
MASQDTDFLLPFRSDDGSPIVIRFRTGASCARVNLAIFDVKGHLVRAFDKGALPPGNYNSTWDRLDTTGARAARGVYIVRLETETRTVSRKLALLR